MTVEIKIIGEDAGHALRELGGLSAGLLRGTTLPPAAAPEATKEAAQAIVDDKPVEQIATPTRERGKPAPGRARRTKEEIAEDEAADKAEASDDTSLGIQSGGERVSPEDEADAEQDAADEAAEDAKTEAVKHTADDVRNAMGLYVNKFGMEAAQADGPGLLVDVLGAPPSGNPFWKLSLIPEDRFGDVIKAWTEAASAKNRKGA